MYMTLLSVISNKIQNVYHFFLNREVFPCNTFKYLDTKLNATYGGETNI